MPDPRQPQDQRPDPEALLALDRGPRGRLKVFLGAAPGVGKSYAMLQGARRLKEAGADVVIGLVETHGRGDTAALTEGLELLPRRQMQDGARTVDEFDIDAALARRPRLLIVDELAHTNASDSRHPKRWQDVEELLDAGIDVWTALNIQHLESLADIVSRITGVAVRERVPDSILRDADEVVVVDITPDELIERLKAGKVYLPETARRARDNFFSVTNLTALRELALRRTADRVDDEIADYRRTKAIDAPWPTSDRLLVCIGPGAELMLRTASRLATALNATWIAVHADNIADDRSDPERERRLSEVLRLAQSLGAETARIQSSDFPADLLALARRENVTQILVGKSPLPRWRRPFRRTLADHLVRRAVDVGVLVITQSDAPRPVRAADWLGERAGFGADAAIAAATVAMATAIGHGLEALVRLPNLSMIFLAAVLASAMLRGTRAAILAAFLSFLAYNFFFIDPRMTFSVARPYELFALVVFLAVAGFAGSLAGRARSQAASALKHAAAAEALSDFARKLSATTSLDDILQVSVGHFHKLLNADAVILLPEDGDLVLRAAWPPADLTDPAEHSAALWALEKAEPAGWRTQTLPNVRFRFQPLATPERVVAVLGLAAPGTDGSPGVGRERDLMALADQTAIAIDRVRLAGEAVRAAALDENERLRDALLASLSHDLRTPLATITGAVTTLRQMDASLTAEGREALLTGIEQETARLTRFVTNLLDMSRLESGALAIRHDWVDVADVVRHAAEKTRQSFPGLTLRLSLAADLPLIRGDARLLEQVLLNLLENAQKYGQDSPVSVHVRREEGELLISVTDEGPGIKPRDIERVFEKFFRVGGNDGRKPGTGLGLSICRGLVTAMGGQITAESPAVRRRGTRFVIRLPATDRPAAPKPDAAS